jgi:ethanolamine utilization cobalamin adenosyltransferase
MAKKTTTKKTSKTTAKKTSEVKEQKTAATQQQVPAAKKEEHLSRQQVDGSIEKIFFNFTDRGVADEFKADLIATGVPQPCISIKKITATGNYKMTITDGQKQILFVVKLLISEKYGLSIEDIQELLGIKITI